MRAKYSLFQLLEASRAQNLKKIVSPANFHHGNQECLMHTLTTGAVSGNQLYVTLNT